MPIQHMANPDLIRELRHLCLTSAASALDLWNVGGNSLADKASLQRPPNDMKHSIEHIKGYRAQEQQNLWLVLLDKCRTELIRKAKCWHTH